MKNILSLNGKRVIVTGGGSGIGKAIVQLFAEYDAEVHIADLSTDQAGVLAAELSAAGRQVFAHACDVSDQQQVVELFKRVSPVDILINNAGVAHVGRADNTSEEDFDRLYRINVKGAYNCIFAAIPSMKQRKSGVILNLASIAAQVGLTDRFAYSMTKGAVAAMTLSVAKDYLADNIRCNSISPARVHTPFVDGFIAKNYPGREEEMFDKLSKSQPVGRMAKPDEVAALALYLCSDVAGFITGNDYPIDGGFIKLNN